MTMQIPDRFNYDAFLDWDLLGMQPGPLFDPAAYGVRPQGGFTACERGYVCRFGVDGERRLKLEELLLLGGAESADPPPFSGVRAERSRSSGPFHRYANLNLVLEYGGTIWLGRDAAAEAGRSAGGELQLVDYGDLRALTFEYGELKRVEAYGSLMAEIRSAEGLSSAEQIELACELTLPGSERLTY